MSQMLKYSQLRLFAYNKCQSILFIHPEYSVIRYMYFKQGEIMHVDDTTWFSRYSLSIFCSVL